MSSSPLKNKKSVYIMLPATLAIWGFVGYKIYQYLNEGDDELPVITSSSVKLNEETTLDSFVVFNNYKDPFLGENGKELGGIASYTGNSYRNNNTSAKNNKQITSNTKSNIPNPPVTDVWPKVIYNGMMTNETTKQSIGFLTIDGSSHRVQAGDNVSDLKVLSFNQNEITIIRGKEKKTFAK